MQKETLTLTNIAQDLKMVADYQMENRTDWRFAYIVPVTMMAIIIVMYWKNIFLGLLLLSVPVYHIVRYVREYRDHKIKKKAITDIIDRGDISISVEELSHIAEETVYEPHARHATKEVKFFYFMSGGSWRVPIVSKHYSWSKDYYLSTRGLENISTAGDEFYYISLKGYYNVAYIYPCKTFELDSNLELVV